MNWNFINAIPGCLSYIVPGYLMLTIYQYILYNDKNDSADIPDKCIKGIVLSFVLRVTVEVCLPKLEIDSAIGYLTLFVVAILFGYILARLLGSEQFQNMLYKIGINRTPSESIWNDVVKDECWIRIYNKDESSYIGKLYHMENFEREPIIQLNNYQKLDANGRVIEDYSQDLSQTIVCNTSQFQYMKVIYQPKN